MLAFILLALWIGYVAGGMLLRYPPSSSRPILQLSASDPLPITEPNSEPPLQPSPQTTAKTGLLSPPQPPPSQQSPPVKTELPASVQPIRQPIRRVSPAAGSSTTVVQVAATERDADAQALAEALNKKGFPAFILNPSNDKYYRVQVGPFTDQQARVTRDALEAQGFPVFMKRQ